MDLAFIWRQMPLFMGGLQVTVKVALVSIVFATGLGVFAGTVRALRTPILSPLAGVYVALIRSTPLLVQLYLLFYGLPSFNIALSPYWTAILALTLNSGAYITEIVRSAVASVARGQWEAAVSLGMGYWQRLRFIVFPQAVRNISPALVGQLSYLVKDTSILGVVTLVELTQTANNIQARYFRSVEAYLPSLLLYQLCILVLLFVFSYVERKTSYQA